MQDNVWASALSGSTCALLGYIVIQTNELLFFTWHFKSLFIGFIAAFFYFVIGFILSFVLLFFLSWSIIKLNRIGSCSLFLVTGILVSSYISYESAWVFNHGQNPFEGAHKARQVFGLVCFGLMGMFGALTSWIYLIKQDSEIDI